MNNDLYFPRHTAKCKCPRSEYCTFPCRTGGIAVYIPGQYDDDEEGNNITNIYCFQQQPTEVWQVPLEEVDTNLASPATPAPEPAIDIGKVVAEIKDSLKRSTASKYDGITAVVLELRHDKIARAFFKLPAHKPVPYDKAVYYLYKANIPANHKLYAKIMPARDRLKDIIRNERLKRDDAEKSVLVSLAATARKEKAKFTSKPPSRFPSPVAIDNSVTGGGWI